MSNDSSLTVCQNSGMRRSGLGCTESCESQALKNVGTWFLRASVRPSTVPRHHSIEVRHDSIKHRREGIYYRDTCGRWHYSFFEVLLSPIIPIKKVSTASWFFWEAKRLNTRYGLLKGLETAVERGFFEKYNRIVPKHALIWFSVVQYSLI